MLALGRRMSQHEIAMQCDTRGYPLQHDLSVVIGRRVQLDSNNLAKCLMVHGISWSGCTSGIVEMGTVRVHNAF